MATSTGFKIIRPNIMQKFSARSTSTFRPILISIEGNIGAGKSTFMESLRKAHPQWNFVDEPVGIWSKIKNDGGESLLEVFYGDRKRWSYTFQSFALLSRFQNIEQSITIKMRNKGDDQMINGKTNVFITERCLGTDFYVFTKMLREEKSMNKLEYDLYCRLYQHLRSQATPLEGIIHVSTEPEECSKRIAGRNRSGESGISIDYLQNLSQCQREWLQLFDGPILESSDQSVLLHDVEKFVEQTIISAGRPKGE